MIFEPNSMKNRTVTIVKNLGIIKEPRKSYLKDPGELVDLAFPYRCNNDIIYAMKQALKVKNQGEIQDRPTFLLRNMFAIQELRGKSRVC